MAAPPRIRMSPTLRDSDAVKRRRANQTQAAKSSAAAVAPVPAHIAAKYLVKGNTYHFDDQTVAFVDKGTALTVQTHNKAIIQDLVAIAKARDWQDVTVSGTKAFRREAWKAAASAGLTVSGYTPSKIERLAVERERSRHDASTTTEAALRESKTGPAVNDLVGIRRAGSTPVTVVERSSMSAAMSSLRRSARSGTTGKSKRRSTLRSAPARPRRINVQRPPHRREPL